MEPGAHRGERRGITFARVHFPPPQPRNRNRDAAAHEKDALPIMFFSGCYRQITVTNLWMETVFFREALRHLDLERQIYANPKS